ncbi:MAG: glucosamine-6-phosphate deaminase [Clostridiales bacterium]|jgi:glucosamine-6-phosphate deaminase|nr:glucosamine-6-phosphate deaminase [Clostridiales bacterium]
MKIVRCTTPEDLGEQAATLIASQINEAIAANGEARIVLSTGASQFTTLAALIKKDIDWQKVTLFHLDEYVGLGEQHPASFVKYMKERFVSKVNLKAVHYVAPWNYPSVDACIVDLTALIREKPIDVGVIGIGENTHIAFNDPPADFDNRGAYKVVELDERCRKQQLGEGWFPTFDDVPKQAISMTPYQIMLCKKIVSPVPYKVKAEAIYKVLTSDVTNMIPATLLKTHPDATTFIDQDSGSRV